MTKIASRKPLLFALAISFVADLTYVSGLSSPFAAEDFNTIFLSSLDFKVLWGNLLSWFRLHPLPFLLTWSIYRISGTRPELYHLSTLLLHIACSLLVYQLAYLLTKQSKAALVAGLVFAPYPRHHQAVLWLACNHIMVQAFFGLLALVTFGMFLRKNRVGYQVVTVLCTAAAVLANEIGLLLFPLLFLLEIAMKQPSLSECLSHLRNPRTYQNYLPFLVVLGIAFGLTFGGQRTIKLSTTVHETYETVYHLRGFGLNEIRRFVAFLVYLVLPQVPIRGLDVTPITLVIATLTVGSLLLLLFKGSPVVRFFVVWILVSPIPFVLFIPWESDRYFYFPAVGLCCLAGTLSWRLYDRIRARQST